MGLDPTLVHGFQPNPNGLGPNIGTMLQNQQQQLQLQQFQQQVKNQNALKGILSQPGALDDNGNPTPDALRQVTALDPAIGMKLRQNALVQQQNQMRMDVMKTQAFGQKLDLLNDTYGPIMERYQEALKAGKTPEQATALAQTELDSANRQLSDGGMFSAQELQTHPTKFDPTQMQGFFGGSKQVMDWRKAQLAAQKDQRTEDRADAAEQEKVRHDKADETIQQGNQEKAVFDEPKPMQWTDDKGVQHQGMLRLNKRDGSFYSTGPNPAPIPFNVQPARDQAADEAAVKADLAQQHPDWTAGQIAIEARNQLKQGSGGGGAGSRESVYFNRVISAGNEAAAAAANIMELPTTTSRGWFGGREQGPGLMAAAKESLTNSLTSQEVQDYNTMMAGVARNLSAIETSGLAPNGSLTKSVDAIVLKEGDSELTKMRKMAELRQIVEKGLEPNLANPHMPDAQKALIKDIVGKIQTAIPFTHHDITELEASKNPRATLSDYAQKSGLGKNGGKPAASTKVDDGAPARIKSQAEYDKLPAGALYYAPDGSVRRKKAATATAAPAPAPGASPATPSPPATGASAPASIPPAAAAQQPGPPTGSGRTAADPVHVQTPDQALRLPPGSFFMDPNGVLRQRPMGRTSTGPAA
jgi:hypothetical protein